MAIDRSYLNNIAGAYDDGTGPGAVGPQKRRSIASAAALAPSTPSAPTTDGDNTSVQKFLARYPGFNPGASFGTRAGTAARLGFDQAGRVLGTIGSGLGAIGAEGADFARAAGLASPISSASAAVPVAHSSIQASPPVSAPYTGNAAPWITPQSAGQASSFHPNPSAVANTVPEGATSISGRPLGFGQMVNGVRTFSDGTGNVPRTMTDAKISALSNGNRLSRADAGMGGGIASEAYGGTPPVGAYTSNPLTSPANDSLAVAQARARASAIGAQRDYASDVAAIVNKDPRSILGSAAWNADTDLSHEVARSRYGIGGASPAQNAINALLGTAAANYQTQARLAQMGLSGDEALAQEGARAQDARALNQQRADLAPGQYVIDPGTGKYTQIRGASATPVTGPAGAPFSIATAPRAMGLTKPQSDMFKTIYDGLADSTVPDPQDPTKQIPIPEAQRYALAYQRATGTQGMPSSDASSNAGIPSGYQAIGRDPKTGHIIYADQKGNKFVGS